METLVDEFVKLATTKALGNLNRGIIINKHCELETEDDECSLNSGESIDKQNEPEAKAEECLVGILNAECPMFSADEFHSTPLSSCCDLFEDSSSFSSGEEELVEQDVIQPATIDLRPEAAEKPIMVSSGDIFPCRSNLLRDTVVFGGVPEVTPPDDLPKRNTKLKPILKSSRGKQQMKVNNPEDKGGFPGCIPVPGLKIFGGVPEEYSSDEEDRETKCHENIKLPSLSRSKITTRKSNKLQIKSLEPVRTSKYRKL